jgi:hypothetical protein
VLAHVAGVNAVVCHRCWDSVDAYIAKIGIKKHLKSKMQELWWTRFVAFDGERHAFF